MNGRVVADERLTTVIMPSGVVLEVWGVPSPTNPLFYFELAERIQETLGAGKPLVFGPGHRVKVLAGATAPPPAADTPHIARG